MNNLMLERPDGAPVDLTPMVAAAHECADEARKIIDTYFRQPLGAQAKSDESPVTIADRAVEARIAGLLHARFPNHAILGEEYGLSNPDSEWRWVIDPIDGTRAFITGRPQFGTLISLTFQGRPILGLIDQPVLKERWVGCLGQTTFTGQIGGKSGARACPSLDEAELSCTAPEMLDSEETVRWRGLAGKVRRVSWGGDCYAYGLLALGLIDIVAESDLKIWDWSAIQPVVEGAGGCVTDWEGNPLDEASPGRVLALGNPALLPTVVQALKDCPVSQADTMV